MPNHLAGETSPYLLQHVDNPVNWYPWGKKRWPCPKGKTNRYYSASVMRPVIGVTSWLTSHLKTRKRPIS